MSQKPKKEIRIYLAKSAGFCLGVKRALSIAFEAAQTKKNICILGDIVHNEKVVKEINRAGIKKIKKLTEGKGLTLLISAHGIDLKTLNRAVNMGYKIIDASCPMVKRIHRIASHMEEQGYAVIIIGDKKHVEVKGIVGQLKKKAILINTSQKFPIKALGRIKKAAVVVQSTQNLEKTIKTVEKLKKYIKDLKFFNTICNPTRIKQQEIKSLPVKNDAMVIIGSRNSANTKRLYEISRSLNKRTYWVESSKDLKPGSFRDVSKVGITAGASTPEYLTKMVIAAIKKISR